MSDRLQAQRAVRTRLKFLVPLVFILFISQTTFAWTDGNPQVEDDAGVAELEAARLRTQRALSGTNAANPVSEDFQIPPAIKPLIDQYLKLASDTRFLEAVHTLFEHPRQMELLYWEAGLLLVWLLARAWLKQRLQKRWFVRFWAGIGLFIVYTFVASWTLPRWILGDSFAVVSQGLFKFNLEIFEQFRALKR